MTQSIGGRFVGWAVRLTARLHLRWAVSRLVHGLRPPLRLRLARLQVRLGYMQGLTLVPEQDLQRSYEAALRLLGDDVGTSSAAYLDFGVYVGTSMACMYRAASRVGASGLRLVGFDSFQGMPEGVEAEDDPRWHAGELYSDLELTRRNLARLNVPLDRVDLVPGWFEESLTDETRNRLGLERAAVVMVDCVISSSTRVALEFCAPLVRDRSIFFFDDWATVDLADRGLGERAAFEAWLAEHAEMKAEELPALSFDRASRAFMISRSPVPFTTTGTSSGG
jgi:O-methyltransferase